VRALLLDPGIEEAIRDAIQRTAAGAYLALPPDVAREIVDAIARHARAESAALLLTQADVRRFVRRLVEVDLPDLVVLSYQSLAHEARVTSLGRVAL
jgi:type III secretion protein V